MWVHYTCTAEESTPWGPVKVLHLYFIPISHYRLDAMLSMLANKRILVVLICVAAVCWLVYLGGWLDVCFFTCLFVVCVCVCVRARAHAYMCVCVCVRVCVVFVFVCCCFVVVVVLPSCLGGLVGWLIDSFAVCFPRWFLSVLKQTNINCVTINLILKTKTEPTKMFSDSSVTVNVHLLPQYSLE